MSAIGLNPRSPVAAVIDTTSQLIVDLTLKKSALIKERLALRKETKAQRTYNKYLAGIVDKNMQPKNEIGPVASKVAQMQKVVRKTEIQQATRKQIELLQAKAEAKMAEINGVLKQLNILWGNLQNSLSGPLYAKVEKTILARVAAAHQQPLQKIYVEENPSGQVLLKKSTVGLIQLHMRICYAHHKQKAAEAFEKKV